MHDLGPVVSAAEARLALTYQLEQETNDLLLSPIDKLSDCLRRRQTTLDSLIDEDTLLKVLCSGRENLNSVIDLTCEVSGLPPELVPLFELSLSSRAGINRIINLEPLISARFAQEKSAILKNIESLNMSPTAAAGKYYRSLNSVSGKK